MTENLKLSPKAFATFQDMTTKIRLYLQGVLDGMGLDGTYKIGEKGELIPDSPQPSNPEVKV